MECNPKMNIAQIIGKFISVRTLKERVRTLTNKFMEKDRTLQFQSGIEEEITELDDLLRNENKTSMVNKKPLGKASKRNINDSSYQKGLKQRSLATHACTIPKASTSAEAFSTNTQKSLYETIEEANMDSNTICNEIEITNDQTNDKENDSQMNPDIDANQVPEINTHQKNRSAVSTPVRNILTPTRKRSANSLKQHTLAYLTKKNDRWYEVRCKELALQEKEKSLQEKKFELENYERRKKIEMEERKSKIELDIYKNQQRLIEIALQKNT